MSPYVIFAVPHVFLLVSILRQECDCALFGSVRYVFITDCNYVLWSYISSPSRKVVGYSSPIVALRKELDLYANIRPVVSVCISVRPANFLIKFSEGRSWSWRKTCRRPYRSPRKHRMSGRLLTGISLILMSHCGLRSTSNKKRRQMESMEKKLEQHVWSPSALLEGLARWPLNSQIPDRARQNIEIEYFFIKSDFCFVCQHLTIIHKSNVLSITDGLFRETVKGVPSLSGINGKYDSVTIAEQLVDSAVYR